MIKKIILLFGIAVILILIILAVLTFLSNRPLTKVNAENHLQNYFAKKALKTNKTAFSGIQVSVTSGKKDFQFQFASGSGKRISQVDLSTPFHVASVGKLMTATLTYQLIDEGVITLDTPIADWLPPSTLEGLFDFKGIDYSKHVTIEHLLSHTSGVADYFDGTTTGAEKISSAILQSPETFYHPLDLIAFTRDHQSALGIPGEHYAYSDTGYVLLGLIIEAVTGQSFENVLENRILRPVYMTDTYMTWRQSPLNSATPPIADIWLNGVEVGDYRSISADWSGGGLISTLEDLMRFSKALHGGDLISATSLKAMFSDQHVFEQGIYTGTGGMTVHFEKFFPLLRLPSVSGHIGVLSTHVFYDATTDTHIVMNFGSTDKMVDSFKALIEIMNTLQRIE